MAKDNGISVDGGTPVFAERCGFGDKYRYWTGRSNRRYLSTVVAPCDLTDFGGTVVVLARRTGECFTAVDVVSPGDPGEPGISAVVARLEHDGGLLAFVHMLAADTSARRALIADLLGEPRAMAA